MIDDVKRVYHKKFDEALEEYNKKQTRRDRRIDDYFEHVACKEQDMAVEIIIQIGDREFWKEYDDMKSYIKLSYQIMLDELMKRLPQFVVVNAVVHLDEDSPHMYVVGVPVADGYKKRTKQAGVKAESIYERGFITSVAGRAKGGRQ
ncbi:MAG: plasmid recombination protein [Lachnospiraceae bacterium]|nr:plasmid recombination protein [Lachnospiraceae bacterium]MDY4616646.1 plasmid recombination protein [Lachnospiraceae bacterium]